MNSEEIKDRIKKQLFDKLGEIDEIISITLVGSFINQKGLTQIRSVLKNQE